MGDDSFKMANELSGRFATLNESEFETLWKEFLQRRRAGDVVNSFEARDKLVGAQSLFEKTLKATHPDCPPTLGKQETSMITRINRFSGVKTAGGMVNLANRGVALG